MQILQHSRNRPNTCYTISVQADTFISSSDTLQGGQVMQAITPSCDGRTDRRVKRRISVGTTATPHGMMGGIVRERVSGISVLDVGVWFVWITVWFARHYKPSRHDARRRDVSIIQPSYYPNRPHLLITDITMISSCSRYNWSFSGEWRFLGLWSEIFKCGV